MKKILLCALMVLVLAGVANAATPCEDLDYPQAVTIMDASSLPEEVPLATIYIEEEEGEDMHTVRYCLTKLDTISSFLLSSEALDQAINDGIVTIQIKDIGNTGPTGPVIINDLAIFGISGVSIGASTNIIEISGQDAWGIQTGEFYATGGSGGGLGVGPIIQYIPEFSTVGIIAAVCIIALLLLFYRKRMNPPKKTIKKKAQLNLIATIIVIVILVGTMGYVVFDHYKTSKQKVEGYIVKEIMPDGGIVKKEMPINTPSRMLGIGKDDGNYTIAIIPAEGKDKAFIVGNYDQLVTE